MSRRHYLLGGWRHSLRGVSPQKRGIVPEKDVERLQRAVEIRALAELELVNAVLDAMRHGGSIREVAAASGLSERTIARWRRGQGLPTHDDWAMPARERRQRLYEAYPHLREILGTIRDKKTDRPADQSP